MNSETVLANVAAFAAELGPQRHERQMRRTLDPLDFARLRDAGFLLMPVPRRFGGFWENSVASARPLLESLRLLAGADSSLALVAAMHPAVLAFAGWLGIDAAPEVYAGPWQAQCDWAFGTARDGHWWGTVTSEPGSSGDVMQTKTAAVLGPDGSYRLTGAKHFGSGAGITSFMMTTALAEGENNPDIFFLDMRDMSADGSHGLTMTVAWDGHGMPATQSHAFDLAGVHADRVAWPDFAARRARTNNGLVTALFTAVIAGIAEAAVETAHAQLARRHASLRPFEQVEWTRAEMDAWLIQQAYAGMVNAAERQAGRQVLLAKSAIAELAESLLTRICRVMGGGTFSRQSPFGFWFEDVRALGFLRPPWALAYDAIFEGSW